ncbi:FAD binding domain-containing protein [Allorhizobium pseudoryzae]|uniref:FAD binding domain-containing protein n=1 Tax=Allorhizobium pseudoryzae TaxID=379684 RepID=UPI003CFE030C
MTHPRSVEEALADLEPEGAAAIAGGTWLMRAPLRHEDGAERQVALHRIEGFSRLHNDGDTISIGPLTTHDFLTHNLPRTPGLNVLREAAGRSANPGVRRLATIGGNIATSAFAAADFAPALLSLDARIAIADRTGTRDIAIEDFLTGRTTFDRPWLVTDIVVPLRQRLTAHERLPMRRAGDYPCAIVSISAEIDDAGVMRDIRIGVGAVEAVARRWHGLEKALTGRIPPEAEEAARDLATEFSGRDAVDAPGWYRTSVLPVLIRRAFATIAADHRESAA